MIKARERIKQIVHRWQSQREELFKRLSEFLRGWGNAFRNGNATQKFCAIDRYVWRRLMMWEHRRRGWNQGRFAHRFKYEWYANLRIYRVPGTLPSPIAHADR